MQRMRLAIHEAVFAAAALVVALVVAVTPATAATVRPVPDQPDLVEMANNMLTVRIDLAQPLHKV